MKFPVLLAVSAAVMVVAASAVPMLSSKSPEWVQFKSRHGKRYRSDAEETQRLATYIAKKAYISEHNKRFAKGQSTFAMGTNKYSDVPHLELVRTMNGYTTHVRSVQSSGCPFMIAVPTPETTTTTTTTTTTPAPTSAIVDWRTVGAVTAVKDQGQCGSCWTFSTTGALEGANFLKTGNLVSLSEQNLIDCATIPGYAPNMGCNGGWQGAAYKYVIDKGGINSEDSYPYLTQKQAKCYYNPADVGGTCSGYVRLPPGNETALMEAVRTIGPVSVSVDASHPSFGSYASGVYYEPSCDPTSLDHAVLVVGYGTDPIGGDYWIVKNSWGTSWGEQGYIRMSRNRYNNCGIATDASYPKV